MPVEQGQDEGICTEQRSRAEGVSTPTELEEKEGGVAVGRIVSGPVLRASQASNMVVVGVAQG